MIKIYLISEVGTKIFVIYIVRTHLYIPRIEYWVYIFCNHFNVRFIR